MSNSKKGSIRNQFFAVLTVNIITFNQGNAIGWVSPALPILLSDESPLGFPLTDTHASLIASMFCVGAMVGTLSYGWLLDVLGRKKAAISTALPFIICWSLKLFCTNPHAIIVGRFIVGFGSAGMLVVAPTYSSELASAENRGVLGSMLTLTFNSGILFIYIVGEYFSYKTVLILMLSIPVIFLFLMAKMPESPSYLVKLGQYQEAANAIAWFRQLPPNSEIVQKEVERLRCEMNSSGGSSNKEKMGKEISPIRFLMRSPPSMKTLCVTGSLLGLQSLIGMFAVLSYASEIFRNAGSTLSPGLSSILVGLLQLCGSIIASVFIERLGRKVLLLSSAFIVSISMACMGTYFYVRDSGYDVTAYGLVPVIFLSLMVFTFAIGIGPIPFILPSEMFLMQVRGLATSLSLIMMWNSTFMVAQFFRSIVLAYGNHVAFWGFACNGFVTILLCVFFVPETKGTSLDEIVAFFGGRKDPIKLQNEEAGVPLKNVSDFNNKFNEQPL